ncbi:hypothetical protein AVEN_229939-1 [Araneus ventricosus]|uniref:Uncharacterized protein n=1 Tax=Araneus ventricosus TaxID=182803 RepID=A0A4Y2BZE5_ARAVE|nr:hypothetical protein AVEN_229939-1 [Araneus ventricosus]
MKVICNLSEARLHFTDFRDWRIADSRADSTKGSVCTHLEHVKFVGIKSPPADEVWKFEEGPAGSATRGLFGEEPRFKMNRGQMRRTTHELAPPSPNFRSTPTGGHLAPTDLTCTRPAYRTVLRWNRVSNLEPSGPRLRPYLLFSYQRDL